ncbi:exocyst complex component Sec10 [Russula ochroleuca]|uniref:Exocyst complex component Sec10 n=1 Tax=Russula ochroleuca TaxID=152965 RepID=A0A9P5N2C3_9AGAM|nr:exocyst complex component Sec10 [Russula ochroleuca]
MDSSTNLDAPTGDALRPQTFQGKFDVKDFIGAFSEKLITQSKADPGPFNPKPFISTFEAAVDRLIALRKDVQAKTEQMEKGVRVVEREYSKKMSELNRGFEAVGTSFVAMEARMNEVGRTAGRIGEQLETVHLQRQRAQAAYDLIDYYTQFSRDDTSRIDSLKKDGKDGRRQVAILLRRLATLAKEIDLPTADKTRESIDRYCEKFEKDMLYLFDRHYRKGDPKMMHHCAQTLLDFNGGASCVQVYVNQHDFFINRVQKDMESDDTILWRSLADPNTISPKSETSLTELLLEIRATVGQEAQIVQAVFPNPSFVMQVFLQRVFAQSIQQHMEQLLTRAGNMSELAFLRVLQLIHAQTSVLVDELKSYDMPSTMPRSPVQNIGLSSAVPGGAGATAISSILETAMEELFVPYTEGQRYLERESKSLAELYSGYLSTFTRYHEREEKLIKTKGSMLDRMMNATATTGASSTSKAAAAIMRFGGITTSDRFQDKLPDEQVNEEDGILAVSVAETMLKWHAEAIGRCAELSPPNDVPKHTFALFRVLAEVIANGYIEVAINTATARLEAIDHTKTEPSLQALSIIHLVDLICHLWQQYVNIALLPLAAGSVVVRREMVVFNNQTVSKIEGAANALMQRLIDAVVAWMSTQLAKQKKTDFKPRNDDDSFARVNTDPCIGCCDILEKVGVVAKQNLSGKNLEVFLTEVGVAFHSQLLEHLRKFPVSATGGLMLAKDLKSYQDTIATFSIHALHERFEFIRQLGNIFLVQPEILKSYITENYLGRIEPALLRPYLAQRSDWGHVEKRFSDDSEEVAGGKTSTKGLRDRFGMGRLSMMMKDLEGLRFGDSVQMGMQALPSGFAQAFGRGDNSA